MIYLASPFFNKTELEMYQQVILAIKSLFPNEELYIPMEHTIPNAWELSNEEWGRQVFAEDVTAIDRSRAVVVIDWGMYSDTGTAWECGYAYAKEKEVYVFSVGEQKEVSLMIANGCTKHFKADFKEVK